MQQNDLSQYATRILMYFQTRLQFLSPSSEYVLEVTEVVLRIKLINLLEVYMRNFF